MLHVSINPGDGMPLYLQLIRQIKHLIATGRLRPDDELPPVRVLAQQLVVNPNTVVRAYRELEVAGLVYKRRGAGTYIAQQGTPYTENECRRILAERADAYLVEAHNLGYPIDEAITLLRERHEELNRQAMNTEGTTDDV